MSKNTEKVLIHYNEIGEKTFDLNIESLSKDLNQIVQVFSSLGVGELKPDDLYFLIDSPEGVYARYRSNQVDKVNKEDSENFRRPIARSYTNDSIELPDPSGLFNAVQNLGNKKTLFLSIKGLYELAKGKPHINIEVLKEYRETFKVYITDPKLIERFRLQTAWVESTKQLNSFLLANFANEKSLFTLTEYVPFQFRDELFLKIDRENYTVSVNTQYYLR